MLVNLKSEMRLFSKTETNAATNAALSFDKDYIKGRNEKFLNLVGGKGVRNALTSHIFGNNPKVWYKVWANWPKDGITGLDEDLKKHTEYFKINKLIKPEPMEKTNPIKFMDSLNTIVINAIKPKEFNTKTGNRVVVSNSGNKDFLSLRRYNELLYIRYRLESLKFNCKLHVKEGYMINAFLSRIGPSIKEIVLNQLKFNNDGYLPFYLDIPNPDDCFNSDVGVNKYDFMYDAIDDGVVDETPNMTKTNLIKI